VISEQSVSWYRVWPLFLAGLNTVLSVGFQLSSIYRLGVGASSDLYYAATIITAVLYTIVFDAVSNVLIPMFVEKASQGNNEHAVLLWNSLLGTAGLSLLILLGAYVPLLYLFPLIFKNLSIVYAGQIGRILIAYALYQSLFCAVTVKNCFLFAEGKPVAAQFGTLVGWVLSLFLVWQIDITSDVSRIAYCLALGNLLTLLFPNLNRSAFVYRAGRFGSHMRALFTRAAPLTSGSVILKGEALLDGALASICGVGSLTVYHVFTRMLLAVSTIVNSGYVQPVTKELAEAAGSNRWKDLRRETGGAAFKSALASIFILMPLALPFVLVRAVDVPRLVVYVQIIEQNFGVFLLLLGYLLGSLVWKVYANGLFVLRKERLFAVVCLSTFAVGFLLKILGTSMYRLSGLAAGTSLYWLLSAAAMAVAFRRSVSRSQIRSWAPSRVLASQAVSGPHTAD
jgi:peptidoglycan biosynthesis protein MviN/MurJ (putative lipid II flippase)